MGPSRSRLVISGQDPLMKCEQRAIDMRKSNKQQKLASKRQNLQTQAIDQDEEEETKQTNETFQECKKAQLVQGICQNRYCTIETIIKATD